jgi:diguanylate cyclase (GGDEF)-like protein
VRLTTRSPSDSGSRATERPRLPARWALAVATAGLLLIFDLDRTTGSAPVQHLYYLPILFAGVRFGMRGGLGAALAAIVSYHLANPPLLTFRYEESDLVQVGLFIAVGAIASKLTRDARRFRLLAMTDDLTGLHNLRSFEARLTAMVRGCRQAKIPLALLVLDVDRLKSLNDRFGHLVGAEAVRAVGHIIAAHVPPDAVACRYGGDEFVVAIPRSTRARAEEIAGDLRRAVNATAPILAGVAFQAGSLSISVGVASRSFDGGASLAGDEEAGEALFREADRALYRAKEAGRNQVSSA